MIAWPFLISRGYDVGQRVVLAPPFLLTGNSHLIRSIGNTDAKDRLHQAPMELDGRHYEVWFRTIRADPVWVGDDNPYLVDIGGRPISVVEGVVVEDSVDSDVWPAEKLLEVAHSQIVDTFADFWRANDQGWSTSESAPIQPEKPPPFQERPSAPIQPEKPPAIQERPSAPIQPEKPPPEGTRWLPVAGAVIGALIAGAAAVFLMLNR